MLLRTHPQQLHAQQWAATQIKRRLRLRCRQLTASCFALDCWELAQIQPIDHNSCGVCDHLHRLAIAVLKHRPQCLMPSYDLTQTALEGLDVKHPTQSHCGRNVVEAGLRL